jgi:asparagine synthetase B (glutamine-hydrolysing)
MFFNIPTSNRTYIKNVTKVSQATILKYEIGASSVSSERYAANFRKKDVLLKKPESYELAAKIFGDRVKKYFNGSADIACALTAGWDSRMILALAPADIVPTAYTYGTEGSIDMFYSKESARLAGIDHIRIILDDEFVNRLPELSINTVYLSSGLERINRSSLLHVYETLTKTATRFPLVMGGIAMDAMFRGQQNSPTLISPDMAEIFKTGEKTIQEEFWKSVFYNQYDDFRDYIINRLEIMENEFGSFDSSEHHLLYRLYQITPKLFSGELKIGSNFTTIRVPFLDNEIIDLSLSIKESTLSFSQYKEHVQGSLSELEMQAYILTKLSSLFAKIPVRETRPDLIFKSPFICKLYYDYRYLRKAAYYALSGRLYPSPLENWHLWFKKHSSFIDDLICSDNAYVRNYFNNEFLKKIRATDNNEIKHKDMRTRTMLNHWRHKTATLEIILRLINNKWEREKAFIDLPFTQN